MTPPTLLLAALAVLALSTAAAAQPAPSPPPPPPTPAVVPVAVGDRLTLARAALAAGRFDDAARELGQAHAETGDPSLLFELGLAHDLAGHCELALAHYDRFLVTAAPSAEAAERTHDRIDRCHVALAGAPADPITAPADGPSLPPAITRHFAGSVQLDYMAVATRDPGRAVALDGATSEVSLKAAIDIHGRVAASVKACIACHGVEIGMAFFDLRIADELNVRVGRFSPALGEFPLRHDPANHRTSDKPLIYDMGRMLRREAWADGVLPAPWVDNGLELSGSHFFGEHLQVDYAAYAVGGPRAGADPLDFNFKLSRSGETYYVDNNSRPAVGGQLVATWLHGRTSLALGASAMRGTYDPEHRLPFALHGAHAVLRTGDVFVRAEYLQRQTTMSLGAEPAARFRYGPGSDGRFDPVFVKDGGYVELEVPVGSRLTLVAREDGLRRRGNVARDSSLRKVSAVLRHTAAIAVLLRSSLRLKLSAEYYDFSDFDSDVVIHAGIAGPF